MDRQPTVALVLELNPKKWGSMEEQTLSLSRALRDRGWRSVIFFTETASGAVLTELQNSCATARVMPPRNSRMFYARLVSTLRELHPALIHFNLCNSLSPLPVVAKLSGAKAVLFTEQVCRPRAASRSTRAKCYVWDRVILRGLDIRVMTPSDHVKRVLVETYMLRPERISVLPQGVNTRRFAPLDEHSIAEVRADLGVPKGEQVVACAAHLIPEKGVGDLLIAAKQLLQSIPNVTVVIAGDGPLARELRQLASDSGIAEKVRFVGLRSDVHRLFASADIVAVPSVWEEPAALVLAEALASGRPVVATRTGGNAEYVEDRKTGILVDRHSPDQLAQALLEILGSPSLATAMGLAARQVAETRLPMERWVNDTLAMYDAALSKG